MDKKTLKALNQSIAKWEKNSVASHPNKVKLGADNCPLCKMFNPNLVHPEMSFPQQSAIGCAGCPVAEKTKMSFCDGSPYDNAVEGLDCWQAGYTSNYKYDPHGQMRAFASAMCGEMTGFLKALLPVAA